MPEMAHLIRTLLEDKQYDIKLIDQYTVDDPLGRTNINSLHYLTDFLKANIGSTTFCSFSRVPINRDCYYDVVKEYTRVCTNYYMFIVALEVLD